MKKVLFDLQLSSFTIDEQLKALSDSNYVFLRALLESIKDDVETAVFVPISLNNDKLVASHYSVYYGSDYYSARFIFDWNSVFLGVKDFNPDLIWTNNPMWVPYYKAVLRKLKLDRPIVCYNHWIDLPSTPKESEKYSLQYLQAAGMLSADVVLTNSNWGNLLIKSGLQMLMNKMVKETFAFPPPLQGSLKGNDNGYCVYNHRISSHPYYMNALEQFKKLMEGVEIPVIFTNPSQKEPIKNLLFDNKFVSLGFDDYLKLLSESRCSVSTLIDEGAQWSMSIVDSVACGIPTLVPRKYGYAEMLPGDYPLYYDTFDEAKDKFKLLINVRLDVNKYSDYCIANYGSEATKGHFLQLLDKVL